MTVAGARELSPRVAELVAALSLATDLGNGFELEKTLRTCLLAVGLGRAAGLDDGELADTYYLALMRSIACTAFAHEEAAIAAGDDVAARRLMAPFDASHTPPAALAALRSFGHWAPAAQRAVLATRFVATGHRFGDEMCIAHFEVGRRLAQRLGMGPGVQEGLGQVWERWDGRGMPNALRGDALPRPVRIMHLTFVAEIAARRGGVAAAAEVVRRRRGGHFDPALADLFVREAPALLNALAVEAPWEAVLAAEPEPWGVGSGATPGELAAVLGDFADLKTPWTLGHSSAVAELATAAADHLGLADVEAVRSAGRLADLGRVSVPNGIWERPGRPSAAEWERIRLHAYYSERVLSYAPALRPVAALAGGHHERLDGSGYHRGCRAAELPPAARLLAAADVYRACREARPYRPAYDDAGAAAELAAEARAGRLDGDAVEAVLAATGAPAACAVRPAGLTPREVEILRAIARGRRSKQVALDLGISVRTVNHHVHHIYEKTGVRSRAGIALFALEHGLLA